MWASVMPSTCMGHPSNVGEQSRGVCAGLRRKSPQVLLPGASPDLSASQAPKLSTPPCTSHCTDTCEFSPLGRDSIIDASWKLLALGIGISVSSQASAFSGYRGSPKRF